MDPIEDEFTSENGDIPACYVSLPEGNIFFLLLSWREKRKPRIDSIRFTAHPKM